MMDVMAANGDPAGGRFSKSDKHPNGGCFARPVGTQQTKNFSLPNFKGDIVNQGLCSNTFAEVFDFQNGIHSSPPAFTSFKHIDVRNEKKSLPIKTFYRFFALPIRREFALAHVLAGLSQFEYA
ncbi:hypothetical protein [Effusibacillus consociatus]|uniref:Uncharacterized protein n=1 Tax=Effusibacillus consociatus TaxID=1117041 RepID=A0ABV9PZ75_9BACL